MNILIPLAIISIYLCFSYRKRPEAVERVFALTMLIAFLLAALRYEFGPDYFSYRKLYEELNNYGIDSYIFYINHTETAFNYYMMLFPYYTLFLAVNSLFWFLLYYRFFYRYTDRKYLWFVVFFLFFNINCILNNLVAMRQAITSYLFIFAFYALVKQRKVQYIAIITLCTLIHTSSLLLYPLVFVDNNNTRFFFHKLYVYIIVSLALLSLFIGRNTFLLVIATYLTSSFEDLERYTTYLENIGESGVSLISIIKSSLLLILNIIPLIFIIQQGRRETDRNYIIIYKLGIIISSITVLFGSGLMSRYMMILNPFYIVALTRSFTNTDNVKRKNLVILVTCFLTVYTLYYYLQADYSVSFLVYHSIFSAPTIP